MPSIVTRYYKNDNAEHFLDTFGTKGSYYFFIANILNWPVVEDIPTPYESVDEIDFAIWDKIIAMKKIITTDTSFVIPRYNWESGTVYNKYKSYVDMFENISASNTFYVINSNFRVYKCIDNNNGTPSEYEPNQTTLTGTFRTLDNYEWKYMYPIVGSDIQKFISTDYIPVQYAETQNNFNTEQSNIQIGAAPGTLDTIDVTNSGNNYINFENYITAYNSPTVLTIDIAGANYQDDDYYNGCSLFVLSGAGAGQLVEIDNYVASTATITLKSPLTVPLATNGSIDASYISIGPKITLKTNGSIQPTAYANVNLLASNGINVITVVNKGKDSTKGIINIEDSSFTGASGSGATAKLNFSPRDGHGSNAIKELQNGAFMFSVRLSRNEEEQLLETENYATFGILQYPTFANGDIITTSTIDNTTKLNLVSVSNLLTNATPLSAWSVKGNTTLATANAISFVSTTDGENGVLSITNIEMPNGYAFATGETITLNEDIAYQGNLASIDYSIAKPYSGEVLYIENREQILRDSSQIEDFKITIQY
jgi:hypothetical protein